METYKEVISNLKFLANLNKGDKINTRFMTRSQDGLITRFIRTFINYDNRQNAIHFVQKTIYNAFEIITQFDRSQKPVDKAMLANIIKDLTAVQVGLSNLKDTYVDDLKFRCDMDTLLQSIQCKLTEYGTCPNTQLQI